MHIREPVVTAFKAAGYSTRRMKNCCGEVPPTTLVALMVKSPLAAKTLVETGSHWFTGKFTFVLVKR